MRHENAEWQVESVRPAPCGDDCRATKEPCGPCTPNNRPGIFIPPFLGSPVASPNTLPSIRLESRIVIGDYAWRLGPEFASGAHGRIHQALDETTGQRLAVKILHVTKDEEWAQVLHEQQLHPKLSHANVVGCVGTHCDVSSRKAYIFMEYMSDSLASLVKHMGPLAEPVARRYTRQIVAGLAYLHGMGVMHRDLKGANILLTQDCDVLKLCDFGNSKMYSASAEPSAHSVLGTAEWMAPEVALQGCEMHNLPGYGRKADVWSLGCTVLEMLRGSPWGISFENVLNALWQHHEGCTPEIPTNLSEQGKDFLRRCLQRDPQERSSAEDLLQHPWLCD